ncbi:MAG: VOC family protein [Clostridia bacterium]|nr:VOC family protein [Deltaproteobacteria bacterium]
MPSKIESLGIKGFESMHYYVRDLERSRRFYTESMDFTEVGVSSPELDAKSKQKSALFVAGDVRVLCSQPIADGSRAASFMKKHPDGIGTIVFEVEDADKAFKLVESRRGTPMEDVQRYNDSDGSLAWFTMTTPFGDTNFRFVERKGETPFYPGFVQHAKPRGGKNRFGFTHIDHITSNFQTMEPALLWMEHVLGLERFWQIQFHTTDVAKEKTEAGSTAADDRGTTVRPTHGSGLKSEVMWDPNSGVKFANNEPSRPFFKSSQIYVFHEDHRGDGIQHAALVVPDIIETVRGMRKQGVGFMPTPGSYYDMLPERLGKLGIDKIDEDLSTLRELEVLVDGEAKGSYMLQIFLKESAALYSEAAAGPFFYEIIQRKGGRGFGGGNFRALFESIEREQRATGRI